MRTKPFIYGVRFLLATATLPAAALLLLGATAAMQNQSGLTPQEKRGKQIYLTGEDGARRGAITTVLGSDELEVPGSSFPCSSCQTKKLITSSFSATRAASRLWPRRWIA
ncbi:MAG TPA: hypothetical protein VGX92_03380 [Pyrinomonadaceae bacterium]|nr:hypothetical protein [Pyrinomonadaceae bacterium]